jgi:RNA polymerase sigma-70 factor (ECF subfamily)
MSRLTPCLHLSDTTPDPRDQIVPMLPALRALAIGIAGNRADADDLVQDAVVKASTHIATFQHGRDMRAWLFTILRNTHYSRLRKHRREVPDPEGLHAATLKAYPDHDDRLAFRDFRRAFSAHSPEHREVLILVGASGLSTQETAHVLGIAPGTVKSRTNRARARLAELMGETPAGPAPEKTTPD